MYFTDHGVIVEDGPPSVLFDQPRMARTRAFLNDRKQLRILVEDFAQFGRDAERYLAVRRTRELRLPTALEHTCDEYARALMRLTANTPPQLRVSERLVA